MKSANFKRRIELPCNHPAVWEEVADIIWSDRLERARAYGRIRERLGLKFKERSWDVIECKGGIEEG